MSLDFSKTSELRTLSRIVADLRSAAGAEFQSLLIGATARDIRLRYQHGLDNLRATEDVDFAVAVADWDEFHRIRDALLASELFHSSEEPAIHRLRHHASGKLDLVPFGGVELADRTIRWPPEQSEVFDCFGLKEAQATCEPVQLPDNALVNVPSIPALALLKITAWRDRQDIWPGKDAPDLLRYVRHYMDCGNQDRVHVEHPDLIERPDFDYDEAGARLLARDISLLMDAAARDHVHSVLAPEGDEDGPMKLARQSGLPVERALRLIIAFVDELRATGADPVNVPPNEKSIDA